MPRVDWLDRRFFALALVGFGLENIAFGHYVVARAAPWPPDPTAQFVVACVTGFVFVACGLTILSGRVVRPAGLAAAVLILGWSLCLHWPKAIAGPAWSGDWTNALKAVVLAWGGIRWPPPRPARRIRGSTHCAVRRPTRSRRSSCWR